ncbi:MAG: hypothetical protein M1816_005527 [Peltula sp. TS41687]|nr:MAG: hypothetical protein M1816_005527 [Peltula sp. TS41687]
MRSKRPFPKTLLIPPSQRPIRKAPDATGRNTLSFGRKAIYLPNFTLTFLRTPFQPPQFASFVVPLTFNKFDLKDYLYHAYGVRVLHVRSYVQQQRVRQDRPGAQRPAPRRWYRPRSIKKMMVEMDKGFVWPEEPVDFAAWDKKSFDAVHEAQEEERDYLRPDGKFLPDRERESIAEQARRLLRGQERWKPVWEDVGVPVEVERNVSIG